MIFALLVFNSQPPTTTKSFRTATTHMTPVHPEKFEPQSHAGFDENVFLFQLGEVLGSSEKSIFEDYFSFSQGGVC